MGINLNNNRRPLKASSIIPMERDTVKLMGDFFGRNVQNRKPEITGNTSVIRILDGNNRYEYHIDNISIEEAKKILKVPEDEGVTNLGRQNFRLLLALLVMAHDQYKGGYEIKGEFKIADLVKSMGAVDGTKTRRTITDLLSSLFSSHFVKIQMIGENERESTIARIITLITSHEIRGQETIYRFELNPKALGRTADWIRQGYIPESLKEDGYLSLPLKEIREKNKSVYYLNLRERVRLVGRDKRWPTVTTSVKKSTLLREWFKFDEDKLKRRTFCRNTIISCLELAKQEGELLSFKIHLPERKGWHNEWEIEITKNNR